MCLINLVKSLILITTYNCNFNCKFCLFKDRLNTRSIDLEILKKILKEAKKLGCNSINLTGGEPCLHPKFNKLMNLLVEQDFTFAIASNGSLYKRYIPLLNYKSKFKCIVFSLESYDEKVHDSLRKKGSYKKVLEAINYFRNKGIQVKVSICLNKKNYKSLKKYIYFVDKLGIREVRILSEIPFNWNKKLVLTDKEREYCLSAIRDVKNKVNVNLRVMSSLIMPSPFSTIFCPVLNLDSITINPYEELIFCCDIPQKGAVLGNLKKEKLKDLLKKGEKIANYLKDKHKAYLESGKKIQGYDTCYFCNEILG